AGESTPRASPKACMLLQRGIVFCQPCHRRKLTSRTEGVHPQLMVAYIRFHVRQELLVAGFFLRGFFAISNDDYVGDFGMVILKVLAAQNRGKRHDVTSVHDDTPATHMRNLGDQTEGMEEAKGPTQLHLEPILFNRIFDSRSTEPGRCAAGGG